MSFVKRQRRLLLLLLPYDREGCCLHWHHDCMSIKVDDHPSAISSMTWDVTTEYSSKVTENHWPCLTRRTRDIHDSPIVIRCEIEWVRSTRNFRRQMIDINWYLLFSFLYAMFVHLTSIVRSSYQSSLSFVWYFWYVRTIPTQLPSSKNDMSAIISCSSTISLLLWYDRLSSIHRSVQSIVCSCDQQERDWHSEWSITRLRRTAELSVSSLRREMGSRFANNSSEPSEADKWFEQAMHYHPLLVPRLLEKRLFISIIALSLLSLTAEPGMITKNFRDNFYGSLQHNRIYSA